MTKSEARCARGRVKIEHVLEGHYEFHIWQEKGIGAPTRAYVCLSALELREVADMIGKMFPDAPDLVEREFGDPDLAAIARSAGLNLESKGTD